MTYADGILFVTENASSALHKISEIYDRIGFAAVGKYNEFENLRQAGVRMADLRGYSYDRSDVTGRMLANTYAQILGTIFTTESKPYEVELTVAEVGTTPDEDQLYRLSYDGSVNDEAGVVAMGGSADAVTETLRAGHDHGISLEDGLRLAVRALGGTEAEPRTIEATQLEVAVLDRRRPRRTFRRLSAAQLGPMLAGD
jgi:proteasome alpha subunit